LANITKTSYSKDNPKMLQSRFWEKAIAWSHTSTCLMRQKHSPNRQKTLIGFKQATLAFWLLSSLSLAQMYSQPTSIILQRKDSINVRSESMAVWEIAETSYCAQTAENGIVFLLPMPGYQELKDVQICFRDTVGNVILRLKRKDLQVASMASGYTLYNDGKYFYFADTKIQPPYTIETNVTIALNGLLFFPDWNPYGLSEIGVQEAHLAISYPPDLPIRYVLRNKDVKIVREQKGDLAFKVTNLPAIAPSTHNADRYAKKLQAEFQLQLFSFGGTSGSAKTWATLGKWQWDLMQVQDTIPETLLPWLSDVKSRFPEVRDRAKAIYAHLQATKRYVSIQKGIGGWKPMPIQLVEQTGYGDCKALSNYAVTLMRRVDVPAFCALVHADERPATIDTTFPTMQFNHVIVSIPLGNDTVWLECTSTNHPFDYLGPYTQNRKALLITPNGGKLVTTPTSTAKSNLRSRTALYPDMVTSKTELREQVSYKGETISPILRLDGATSLEKTKWLSARYHIGQQQVATITMGMDSAAGAKGSHVARIILGKEVTVSSKRLYYSQVVADDFFQGGLEVETIHHNPLRVCDSLKIPIPTAYHPEYLPPEMALDAPFGSFHRKLVISADWICIVRELELFGNVWQKEAVQAYKGFAQAVQAADAQQVIFVKE
jgi:transglutaminase-like putative cysteine protease